MNKSIEPALLLYGLVDSPRVHLGNTFDYLIAGKTILMAPDDHSVVGDLIRETKAGHIANTPEEVCDQLSAWYKEWQQTGQVKWYGNQKAIEQYSRESQVSKFCDSLEQHLSQSHA